MAKRRASCVAACSSKIQGPASTGLPWMAVWGLAPACRGFIATSMRMQLARLAAAVLDAAATPTHHQAARSGHVSRRPRVSLPCRLAATPTNQPKWRHKEKLEASRLAGRSGKCSRALPSIAGHICFMEWYRETHTRFTCRCCDGQNLPGVTIGFLLARFKWGFLCLTNHIVILRLEKTGTRLESEQEPLAQCIFNQTSRAAAAA